MIPLVSSCPDFFYEFTIVTKTHCNRSCVNVMPVTFNAVSVQVIVQIEATSKVFQK